MAKLKIGIVGCGAIGSSLAKFIVNELSAKADLVAFYDIDILKSRSLSKTISKNKDLSVENLIRLINKSHLVIESASAKNSWDIARKVLEKGRDIMIMSVGGLTGRFKDLTRLANRYDAHVYIPTGAISGIDALKAAKIAKIKEVILTTRKHPFSFKGVEYIEKKGIDLNSIKEDFVLFSGSAKDAVNYFPQNINVAAILSIAGIGETRTRIKIIASPKVNKNIHEIQIYSEAGTISTRTENILHPDNPKTSYLAFLSAAATLKQILEPVRIGT